MQSPDCFTANTPCVLRPYNIAIAFHSWAGFALRKAG